MRPGTALFVMLPLVAVVAAFLFVAQRGAGAGPVTDGVYWDEQIAQFLRRRVANTYVDALDEERGRYAFHQAMDAYVHALDEYSDFIPPEEHRRWRESTTGRYAGLGIKITPVDEGLEIIGLLPRSPAALAGLKSGDVIVSADGTSLAGLGTERVEAQGLLKGEPGSPVAIGVLAGPRPPEGQPWGPERVLRVNRALIRPPDVYARRVGANGEYGVIRLSEFTESTEGDFETALQGMLDAGVKAVVLDLRGNGGGVLPTAVAVADRFVDRGVIVRMEGRTPRANRVYEAKPENTVSDTLPLVVLVDGRSASASEVVAGALQDHRRALLVGERTYGKFLVQQITDVPDHEVALQLTTSRYYLPSGRSYQRSHWNDGGRNGNGAPPPRDASPAGILPDVVVPLDEAQRDELLKFRKNEEAVPWGEAKPFPEIAEDWVDPQLARGIELLEGQLVLRRIRGTAR